MKTAVCEQHSVSHVLAYAQPPSWPVPSAAYRAVLGVLALRTHRALLLD